MEDPSASSGANQETGGVRSMAELRNEDLSCIESATSTRISRTRTLATSNKVPLFDLYSIIVDAGKLRTKRIVSLTDGHKTDRRGQVMVYRPDFFTHFHVGLDAIPDSHDIFALPDTDCTPADLRPLLAVLVLVAIAVAEATFAALIKHITHDATDEVLPYTICDTLS